MFDGVTQIVWLTELDGNLLSVWSDIAYVDDLFTAKPQLVFNREVLIPARYYRSKRRCYRNERILILKLYSGAPFCLSQMPNHRSEPLFCPPGASEVLVRQLVVASLWSQRAKTLFILILLCCDTLNLHYLISLCLCIVVVKCNV